MTLTQPQIDKLIQVYATDIVDGMDMRDLCQFAIDMICSNMCEYGEDDLKSEISEIYNEEYWDNLIQEVTE